MNKTKDIKKPVKKGLSEERKEEIKHWNEMEKEGKI